MKKAAPDVIRLTSALRSRSAGGRDVRRLLYFHLRVELKAPGLPRPPLRRLALTSLHATPRACKGKPTPLWLRSGASFHTVGVMSAWSHVNSPTYGSCRFGGIQVNAWLSMSNNEKALFITRGRNDTFPGGPRSSRVHGFTLEATRRQEKLYNSSVSAFHSLLSLCVPPKWFSIRWPWGEHRAVKCNTVNSFIFRWRMQGRLFLPQNVCVRDIHILSTLLGTPVP